MKARWIWGLLSGLSVLMATALAVKKEMEWAQYGMLLAVFCAIREVGSIIKHK